MPSSTGMDRLSKRTLNFANVSQDERHHPTHTALERFDMWGHPTPRRGAATAPRYTALVEPGPTI